ncbi:MAG: hypothetical protein ACXVDI_13290 [Ktedonobacterales bacterium]
MRDVTMERAQPVTGSIAARGKRMAQRAWKGVAADWGGSRFLPWGLALVAMSTIVVVIYYQAMPYVEFDPDTRAYLNVAAQIEQHGQLVDVGRLPGYPLLIVLVGATHLAALSVVQAALFVAAVVEVYAILCVATRRAWLAATVAGLIGANIHVISYDKPILSEALTLFFTTTLALAVTLCIRRMSVRRLWAVAISLLALFLTRPEWIYLPIPLLGYLLLLAWRRGLLRRLAPQALLAAVVLYGVLGLYISVNGVQHNFFGLTYVQNINLLGKVMQYGMHDEAPARYADVQHLVDSYMAKGDTDPWDVIRTPYPPIQRHYFALAGEYAVAIIKEHPVEYLGHSLVLGRDSLGVTELFRPAPHTPVVDGLHWLADTIMRSLVWFPLLALAWWVMVARPRADLTGIGREGAEMMGALALIAFYGLAITTLGGYIYYGRLHTPFDPLLIVVVWGSVLLAVAALAERVGPRLALLSGSGR